VEGNAMGKNEDTKGTAVKNAWSKKRGWGSREREDKHKEIRCYGWPGFTPSSRYCAGQHKPLL